MMLNKKEPASEFLIAGSFFLTFGTLKKIEAN